MASVAKLRRTWFALLKEQRVSAEDRHWLQERLTGKASTRDWVRADWDKAIAALQQDSGLHKDKHAHVREDRDGAHVEPGTGTTRDQVEYIEGLCDRLEWRIGRGKGPVAYFRRAICGTRKMELRGEIIRQAAADADTTREVWARLTRQEAGDFIRALIKLERTQARRRVHA